MNNHFIDLAVIVLCAAVIASILLEAPREAVPVQFGGLALASALAGLGVYLEGRKGGRAR